MPAMHYALVDNTNLLVHRIALPEWPSDGTCTVGDSGNSFRWDFGAHDAQHGTSLLSEARCYVSAQGGGAPTVAMDSQQASCFVEVAYRQDDAGTFHYRWRMEFMTAGGLISYLYMNETVGSDGPIQAYHAAAAGGSQAFPHFLEEVKPPIVPGVSSKLGLKQRAGAVDNVLALTYDFDYVPYYQESGLDSATTDVLGKALATVGASQSVFFVDPGQRDALADAVQALGASGGLAGLADRAAEGMVADRRAYRRLTFAEQLAQSLEAAGAPAGVDAASVVRGLLGTVKKNALFVSDRGTAFLWARPGADNRDLVMPNYRNETRRLRVVDVGDTALIAGELVYRDHTEGELGYAMRRSNVPRGVHRYSEGNVYRLNRYDADGNPLTGGTVTLEIEEIGGASRSWFHLADGERLYRPLEEAGGSATYLGAGVWRLVTPTSDIFSASSATAGLIGDPYVCPLLGGMYKLPADNLTYRLLETPELVVNAKMDLLHGDDRSGTEAWEREWRRRYATAYRTPPAPSYMRYLYVRTPSEEWGVDLETLEFVRPREGVSWSRAAASRDFEPAASEPPRDHLRGEGGGVRIRREGRCARLDALWERVAAPYARLRTERLLLQVPTPEHGAVTLTCTRYPHDPQVRTAVTLAAQREVTREAARGILVARARRGAVVPRLDHTQPLRSRWIWDDRPGRPSQDRILVGGGTDWLRYTK